jgi:hypothetical protein
MFLKITYYHCFEGSLLIVEFNEHFQNHYSISTRNNCFVNNLYYHFIKHYFVKVKFIILN